ncbi:MAG: exo-alpha-sialidase [Planctomycetaceae bacterium]|nr:exo-alpha-sialidase [Planctomycetaceae bacterium]
MRCQTLLAVTGLLFIAADDRSLIAAQKLADFETQTAGPMTTIDTPIGRWTVESGTAVINDRYASRGQQCLQLTGGAKTVVTIDLAQPLSAPGELAFDAERWTRRTPFVFRIEQKTTAGWEEIYRGDDRVLVGRSFRSQVRVPLESVTVSSLRWTVSSPEGTGLLLDHVRISPAVKQKIVSVEAVPFALPLLRGASAGPLAKLKIETEGRLEPVSLQEVGLSLDDGSAKLLNSVTAFACGSSSAFRTDVRFAESLAPRPRLTLAGDQPLKEGTNFIWVAATVAADADIDQAVTAALRTAKFSDGSTWQVPDSKSTVRLGVKLRDTGDDGVNTYRIPGLVTTNAGSLICVYDVRYRSSRDLPGDIDVGMSRSVDGGRTWQPMCVIMDMGDDPDFRYDGIGDPCVLVDRQTGTIWCAATWSHGNRSWVGSKPGLEPEDTGQWMLVRSDDDGVTWSKPVNITRQVKRPEWSFLLQGPGRGITMRDGTLVFPAQYQDPPSSTDKVASRLPHSSIIYSKDHGATWQAGTGACDDTTEAQVAELEDGRLMLNCRYNRTSYRVIMTSDDLGQTWHEHPGSRRQLREPRACMASLINVDRDRRWLSDSGSKAPVRGNPQTLLFSNPDSFSGRHHMTIRMSKDSGASWPTDAMLLLDEEPGRGYSCLTMIDQKTVGIVYEGSQSDLVFQRIPLTDIAKD